MQDMIIALLPIFVVIVSIFVFKLSSANAGVLSYLVAVFIALMYAPYRLSNHAIVTASIKGFLTATIVIYVLLFGILLFHLMKHAGLIQSVSSFVQKTTKDPARQVIILGIAFSPLIESASGFGIGVIVIAPILIALGFDRFKAALLSLVSLNAVPWGALATGAVIGSNLSGVPLKSIGVGSAYLSIPTFIYFSIVSIYIVKGKKGIAEKWLELLAVSSVLSIAVWFSNQYISVELAGVIGALVALGVEGFIVYILEGTTKNRKECDNSQSVYNAFKEYLDIVKIMMPYLFLTSLIIASRVFPSVQSLLTSFFKIEWPEYDFSLALLHSPGFFLFITCLFTVLLFQISAQHILHSVSVTLKQLTPIAITTISFITMAEVMASANLITTLAHVAGETLGSGFFWVSPLIAGLSGFLTGSNAASNAMFMKLQVQIAGQVHLSSDILASIQNACASHMTMASPSRVLLAALVSGKEDAENPLLQIILYVAGGSLILVIAAAYLLSGNALFHDLLEISYLNFKQSLFLHIHHP